MIDIEVNSPRWLSLEDLPNERWKDITGYEGLYQISDYGRVKSLNKPDRGNQFAKERIMVINPNKNGYSTLHFAIKGNHYRKTIHKLVALAFLDNPNNYPFVLHKKAVSDGGTNHYSNLYWGTQKDNMRDRKRENKYIVSQKAIDTLVEKQSIPINQYGRDGTFVKTWKSAVIAGRCLNIDDSSIRKVCRGVLKLSGGYQWRIYNNNVNNIEPYQRKKSTYKPKYKAIAQFDKNDKLITIWSSVKEIHDKLNFNINGIYRVCRGERKTYKSYIWRYYEEVKDELDI